MGIDNSLSLQELTSPSSLTPAGKTLESLARETTPPGLPSFLSLSFSPFSHFTHPQPDGLLTEMESESQAQLSQQHPPVKTSLPDAIPSNLFTSGWCLGISLCYVSTEQHLHEVNCNRGSAASGREPIPEGTNAIGDSRKTTETETRSPLATVHACTVCRWSIPGKI